MTKAVYVENLTKKFQVVNKKQKNRFIRFIHPEYHEHEVVSSISFEINKGERVAFIGPNGAGKSTTIKMLTGIFLPTSGRLEVLGLEPYKQRELLAYKIGAVFGQRSQLWYHLSPLASFNLLATIYKIPKAKFLQKRDELIELFDVERFINRSVKELSLGERTRCELIASLIHSPEILFLDEPTIGLDIISKSAIRDLIQKKSIEESQTVFLTSHDIADIEKVCDRIIVINKGKIVIDTTVANLKKVYVQHKYFDFRIHLMKEFSLTDGMRLLDSRDSYFKVEVDLKMQPLQKYLDLIAKFGEIKDLTIQDPSLEDIIKKVYQEQA
jgi:ABC-2 type transport system ATP-binding protein